MHTPWAFLQLYSTSIRSTHLAEPGCCGDADYRLRLEETSLGRALVRARAFIGQAVGTPRGQAGNLPTFHGMSDRQLLFGVSSMTRNDGLELLFQRITVPERKNLRKCTNGTSVGHSPRGCQPHRTPGGSSSHPTFDAHSGRCTSLVGFSGSPLRHNNHTLAGKDVAGALTTLIRRVRAPLWAQFFAKRGNRLAVLVHS